MALTDRRVALPLQEAGPALLTPKKVASQPGASSCKGNPCCLTSFFQNASPFPVSMDSLADKGAVGRGGVEQLKFSKERGTPAGPHIKER